VEGLSSTGILCGFSVVGLGEALFARRSVSLTGGAVFGGLAALSTVVVPANIQPFFPILPFLRFDPAELFSVLAFLIFGPVAAVIAATSHWIFLTATGTSGPLGPAAKFASVLSTLFGLWLGGKVYQRIGAKISRMSFALGLMLAFAVLARVFVMFIVNYFIFTYVGPVIFGFDYLGFGQKALQLTLGVEYAGSWLLMAMLLYTSVFNGLHAAFSVIIPYMIFTPLSLKIPEIASGHPWVSRFTSH
jgi:riboflavin transporter FmnP